MFAHYVFYCIRMRNSWLDQIGCPFIAVEVLFCCAFGECSGCKQEALRGITCYKSFYIIHSCL